MKALYMGDTTLETGALYLSLILEHLHLDYVYVPSSERLMPTIADSEFQLYIISDYPAKNFDDAIARAIVNRVKNGAGLLMIGGWESFQGNAGGYHQSIIAEALPVHVSSRDDRVNSADACCVVPATSHSVTKGLPFHNPPFVAGYNRIRVKSDAHHVLSVVRHSASVSRDGSITIEETFRDPWLVAGNCNDGRTAALASDLAPHWVGGFVDWGTERILLRGEGREVEVGNYYVRFIKQLLAWLLIS